MRFYYLSVSSSCDTLFLRICYITSIVPENEELICDDGSTVLSKTKCAILTKLLDEKWLDNPLADFKLTLTADELSRHIGSEHVLSLSKLLNDNFDKIMLRRCTPEGLCINFHLDVTERVMQVALNDESEYSGGRLMFLTGNGELKVPKRIAGSFTIHNNFIVHGVSEHTRGLRYGLFFLKFRDSVITKGN